jgi:ankyrin repeat protein
MKCLGSAANVLVIRLGVRLVAAIAVAILSATIFSARADQQATGTAPNASGITPLLAAVGAGNVEQVSALLAGGAKPDDPTARRSPLVQAITLRNGSTLRCDLPMVRVLLGHGADPNRPDPRIGSLPLLTAFATGDVGCAQTLRDAGARVDSRDSGAHTILTSAVGAASRSGDTSIIDVVLSWGIGINSQAADGYTALHEAVRIQSTPVVEALLQRGADPCIKNRIGQTPLAMSNNLKRDSEMIKTLRDVGCAAPKVL